MAAFLHQFLGTEAITQTILRAAAVVWVLKSGFGILGPAILELSLAIVNTGVMPAKSSVVMEAIGNDSCGRLDGANRTPADGGYTIIPPAQWMQAF
jgi:hypothetical protein